MKAKPASMPAWANFNWKTFGDSKLEKMEAEAGAILADMEADKPPRWLSLLGSSGVGKTHLAKQIYRHATARFGTYICPRLHITQKRTLRFIEWRTLADQLRNKEYHRINNALDPWLLVLDDLGSEYDPSGYLASRVDRILNERLGKWTVFTSNLCLDEVADKLDVRVADRMMRADNRIADVDTKSYALR